MKVLYKANINDLMNPSDESALESDHYSNDEIESEDQEDDNEEVKVQEINARNNSYLKPNQNIKRMIDDPQDNTIPKKRKKLERDLYKPPTVEELNQLRETENLFHSNLFRLQIEEMLNEIRIKDKYKTLFYVWFEKLEETIKSIKETEQYQLAQKKLQKKLKMHIPMPNTGKKTKG